MPARRKSRSNRIVPQQVEAELIVNRFNGAFDALNVTQNVRRSFDAARQPAMHAENAVLNERRNGHGRKRAVDSVKDALAVLLPVKLLALGAERARAIRVCVAVDLLSGRARESTTQAIQHHATHRVFVISAQQRYLVRRHGLERQQMQRHLYAVRAAINIVAQKEQVRRGQRDAQWEERSALTPSDNVYRCTAAYFSNPLRSR